MLAGMHVFGVKLQPLKTSMQALTTCMQTELGTQAGERGPGDMQDCINQSAHGRATWQARDGEAVA